MRIIIRFSVDGEIDGALRNKLLKALRAQQITKQPGTGTYECSVVGTSIGPAEIQNAMDGFWGVIENHKRQKGRGRLDHFWMYVDRQTKPNDKAATKKAKPAKSGKVAK